jgi:hypothetical protein
MKLFKALENGDKNIFKGVKKIGDEIPMGYEKINVYFVDNSGLGTRGEMALTADDFLSQVKKGYYYGISSVGQFQVYITEFKKLNLSRRELYDINGIKTSKLVKNNTRLTEYEDGRRTLKLHNTDIITWTGDKIILNSGGYRTHTTKARINEFLPSNIRVYQKKYNWYIIKDNDDKNVIEFTDGIELTA